MRTQTPVTVTVRPPALVEPLISDFLKETMTLVYENETFKEDVVYVIDSNRKRIGVVLFVSTMKNATCPDWRHTDVALGNDQSNASYVIEADEWQRVLNEVNVPS